MSVWREVQETLYQRWAAGWVDGDAEPLTPFCFANEKFDPPDAPWARVSARRLPGGQASLGKPGSRRFDRAGLLFIQLFEPPAGSGEGETGGVGRASDLAERAAGLFEGCRFEPHAIRFAEVEPTDAFMSDNGRWWAVVVEGRFDYEQVL